MKAMQPASDREPGAMPADVCAWRMRVLSRAGFDSALAAEMARDQRYDLHSLLDLVDRGCPPHLAARIAAPI